MKRLKSIVIAALAVVVAGTSIVVPATPASAATSTGSSALSIAPKKNYVIEPGKSVKDTLVIRNLDGTSPLNLSLRVIDFSYTDDGGTPKLYLDEDAAQTTWSLKPFMTVPESVTIPAGGSKTVDMSVSIPAGHGAGSYYSAIVYSTGAPSGGNVGLSASGVTLVFTNVPGKVNENLKLEKLGAYQTETTGTKASYVYFTGEDPKNIAYTLKNSGNVVESPAGTITVSGLFGSKVTIDNINPNSNLALIGQSRTFTSCVKLKETSVTLQGTSSKAKECDKSGLWPGYYKVSFDAYYGQNGNTTQEVVGTAGFWYLPIWFLILVAVIIIILALAIWWAVRKIKGKARSAKRGKSSLRK